MLFSHSKETESLWLLQHSQHCWVAVWWYTHFHHSLPVAGQTVLNSSLPSREVLIVLVAQVDLMAGGRKLLTQTMCTAVDDEKTKTSARKSFDSCLGRAGQGARESCVGRGGQGGLCLGRGERGGGGRDVGGKDRRGSTAGEVERRSPRRCVRWWMCV